MSLDYFNREKTSIRDQWSRQHATTAIKVEVKEFHSQFPRDVPLIGEGGDLPAIPSQFKPPKPRYPPPKLIILNIGIVGAGVAGLFAAKVLDHLNYQLFLQALGDNGFLGGKKPTQKSFHEDYVIGKKPLPSMLFFKYEILEAAGTERVGGRLFTYDFGEPQGPHDYYDVGAMRFPKNPVMTR